MHKNKDFGFLIYIYIYNICYSKWKCDFSSPSGSVGPWLTWPSRSGRTAWGWPLPAAAQTALFPYLEQVSTERRQVMAWKTRGDFFFPGCFRAQKMCFEDESTLVLPSPCHQASARTWGKGGASRHFLGFFSPLPWQASSRNGFPASPQTTPHVPLCLDLFLGTSEISEVSWSGRQNPPCSLIFYPLRLPKYKQDP